MKKEPKPQVRQPPDIYLQNKNDDKSKVKKDRNIHFGPTNSADVRMSFDAEIENKDSYKVMDSQEVKKRHNSRNIIPERTVVPRKSLHEAFNADILFISDQVKSDNTEEKSEKNIDLFDIEADRNTFKKVNVLRYRENVFRAAGRITRDLPPFPHWTYRDKPENLLNKITFIVGGTQFQCFEDTILHIPNSKLASCVIDKSGEPVFFFDRDPACFNYVLNFYRTGRLHAPSSACLSFFEEELEFWGINEEFMEPCCYSQYMAYKKACNTLKKFSESKDKSSYTEKNTDRYVKLKTRLYMALNVGNNTLISQWYSVTCGTCIISAIMILFFGTSVYGRTDLITNEFREMKPNESLMTYFEYTGINSQLLSVELILSGYFVADIVLRWLFSPNSFVFFTDTINWIDVLATISSLLSTLLYDKESTGFNEAYIIILKIPRIFRLFKLTTNLKSGMDAIILTIRASTSDLILVFLIVIIFVSFFGILIFVVELVNEVDEPSKFKTVYIGMWWAIVTMATVGYGDYIPNTQSGYLVGCMCIVCGIIIFQLPVPIFLRNFSIYYNQAQSRLTHQTKVLSVSIDPESLKEAQIDDNKNDYP